MRPTLLKSFIVVILFWFFATTMWWSLQNPEVNLKALMALKQMMPFLPITVPAEASILNSIVVQTKVIGYWTIPMLTGTVISGLIGYGAMWFKARGSHHERLDREKGKGEYRGVTLTVGDLPMPQALPKEDIDLGADNSEELSRLTEKELKLLTDVIGTLVAHPNAYPGEGITTDLVEHAISLVETALQNPRYPGLSAIVAAAHELGKITAYTKKDGEWVSTKNHDKEAARILGYMNSWYDMPYQEKNAIMMAVKYKSNPRYLPEIDSDPKIYRLAKELLTVHDDTQQTVVVEQKQKTLEKNAGELPDVIFESFLKAIPQLSFQNRGLPKGVAAVAWKVKNRVYMIEIKLRETVMAKLPADVRGALTPSGKDRSAKLQPFTVELLKSLESRGWLVKKIGEQSVEAKEALWNIKAGKLDFKGIIVVDIPEEFIDQLPRDDSMYEITVTGPLFNNGGGGASAISREDLLSSVLKPSAPKPAPQKEVSAEGGQNSSEA